MYYREKVRVMTDTGVRSFFNFFPAMDFIAPQCHNNTDHGCHNTDDSGADIHALNHFVLDFRRNPGRCDDTDEDDTEEIIVAI